MPSYASITWIRFLGRRRPRVALSAFVPHRRDGLAPRMKSKLGRFGQSVKPASSPRRLGPWCILQISVGRASPRAGSSGASPHQNVPLPRLVFHTVSEFPMQTRRKDRYWSAITVERQVGDVLVIQGGVDGFPEFEIIVCLQDFFPAIIQIAVARQNPVPPASKNSWWTCEMPLSTPARPTVSSGRPHDSPLMLRPAVTV